MENRQRRFDRAFHEKYFYSGRDLGAQRRDGRTVFKLWSPYADEILLHLYPDGGNGQHIRQVLLKPAESGLWIYEAEEDLSGVYYDFEIRRGDKWCRTADPYARACGANSARSMVVDLKTTDPDGWENDRPPAAAKDPLIYELHVKDFSWDKSGGFPEDVRGTYRAFLYPDTTLNGGGAHPTGLAHLKALGVTHVQLMPVYDFGSVDETGPENQFNWGYDPVNYNVPEGSYSSDPSDGAVRIREMKEMIQSLHKNGFRVIMDVVYNHTYSRDSWLDRTLPGYYYRHWEDGTPSNGSACGNDVTTERPMCSQYICDSVMYWAREYHIDGFRFDLMGLLDVDLMNRIRREMDEAFGRGEILLYGEPWSDSASPMEEGSLPCTKNNIAKLDTLIGVFCDNTRDAVRGHVFETKEPGFVNGGTRLEQDIYCSAAAWRFGDKSFVPKAPSQVLTYISAHDNLTLWDKIAATMDPKEGFHTKDIRVRKAYRLAAAVYLMCQGIHFMLSGEEFARTKEGDENSYKSSIEINRLDWRLVQENRDILEYYRGLIALRRELPGVCDLSEQAASRIGYPVLEEGFVSFHVDNAGSEKWEELLIAFNAGERDRTVKLPGGSWELLTDGTDSFLWENPHAIQGEYRIGPLEAAVFGRKAEL